jgi:alpha-beta hydrolase superfamily lysophospholipase
MAKPRIVKIAVTTVLLAAVAGVLAAAGLALAVVAGGPKPIAGLASINNPFKSVDYRQLPPLQRYSARDGAQLAYRHYPAASTAGNPLARRVVVVHGSSASSRSVHPMAQALQAAGFNVDALDVRGHGDSGTRGHIAYIGQLEDDLVDFMRAVPEGGPATLIGFSAGGGFALRFSASPEAALFERYLLLAPFLVNAPSNRPDSDMKGGGWASVGLPRIVALTVLNRLGVTRWNDLQVTQFALSDEAKKILTPAYSFALAANFGAHLDYAADIARSPKNLQVLAGSQDELMLPEQYARVFASGGNTAPVTLVPGADHIGLTVNAPALAALVAVARR